MLDTETYTIKTYDPEFFDAEIALTQEFEESKNLQEGYRSFAAEAQITGLKNYRENGNPNFPFVPADHFYLFDENKTMLGHIHAFPQPTTKRCSISSMVIKEGHEKGAELLLKSLIDSVKEREYEVLVKNATEDHAPELEFLNQFGFEKIRVRNIKSRVPITTLNLEKNDKYTLVDFDSEKHREEIITKLYLPKGYQQAGLDAQFDNLITARENGTVPSWQVALQDDEIIGQSIAFYGRQNIKDLVQFNTVTTNLEGDESLPLINAIYSAHLEKLPENITQVEHYLFGQVIGLRPIYESIGFKYLENHLYEKSI